MYFALTTFGCKVNQYESSGVAELMRQNGYIPADSSLQADVHIINSCTVTENSDRKVKALISRLRRDNPAIKIILCGCFPKAFPEKAASAGADTVIPGAFAGPVPLPYSPQTERTRAFLKIQDGCNRSCAYCIIPKARGPVKSRAIDDIRSEAEMLAGAGHKEIVITGINLCAYEHSLVEAVKTVSQVNGIKRVRMGSLEPDMISVPDIVKLSELDKLCPHFHLSLQSGSDSVLKRMNRQYTADYYRNIAGAIREHFPSAALTTDIIAGFPGETEEEFIQTLRFAEEIKFAKIHAFAFSRREGTPAADMQGQIPKEIKQERTARLCELAGTLRTAFFEGLARTLQEVLVEKSVPGGVFGHTPCYTPVKIVGEYDKNSVVKVKIAQTGKEYCIGEPPQ